MQVLLYNTKVDGSMERLQQLAAEHDSVDDVEVVRSVAELNLKLRSPPGHPDLVVLAVNQKKELAELFSLGELITETRLVLVLPDRDAGTVALAHRLRPRFVAYTDGDPEILAAVVLKMIANSHPRN
jgi:hypothetical protein